MTFTFEIDKDALLLADTIAGFYACILEARGAIMTTAASSFSEGWKEQADGFSRWGAALGKRPGNADKILGINMVYSW